jgi:NAD+ kinase
LNNQLIQKAGVSADYEVFRNHKDFHSGLDLVISMGGDGTFLKTVSYIRNSGVPIMGINTGRLGFLANISKDAMYETLSQVKNKEYEFQLRSLLRVHTEEDLFGADNFALNELTLHKKDTSSMITVHASLDNKYLNTYWADGLINATPTGSTAYSLSCGGPIILPNAQNFVITPIAPHNLNVRPIIVPDNVELSFEIEARSTKFLLSCDSRTCYNICKG